MPIKDPLLAAMASTVRALLEDDQKAHDPVETSMPRKGDVWQVNLANIRNPDLSWTYVWADADSDRILKVHSGDTFLILEDPDFDQVQSHRFGIVKALWLKKHQVVYIPSASTYHLIRLKSETSDEP